MPHASDAESVWRRVSSSSYRPILDPAARSPLKFLRGFKALTETLAREDEFAENEDSRDSTGADVGALLPPRLQRRPRSPPRRAPGQSLQPSRPGARTRQNRQGRFPERPGRRRNRQIRSDARVGNGVLAVLQRCARGQLFLGFGRGSAEGEVSPDTRTAATEGPPF